MYSKQEDASAPSPHCPFCEYPGENAKKRPDCRKQAAIKQTNKQTNKLCNYVHNQSFPIFHVYPYMYRYQKKILYTLIIHSFLNIYHHRSHQVTTELQGFSSGRGRPAKVSGIAGTPCSPSGCLRCDVVKSMDLGGSLTWKHDG